MTRLWMMTVALGMVGTIAHAADKADPKRGQALMEKNCISCHVSMYGGDGSQIYLRPDRKIKNLRQLEARVAGCNANTGAGLFPEEEADIIAYLNQKYYKFK